MINHDTMKPHFSRFHGRGVLRVVGLTVGGIILAAIFALVFGLVVKALWNWIMPAVFGLGVITYWQAFGIVILAKILFSGIGSHQHHDHYAHFKVRQRRFYDCWWREEGKTAFDAWLVKQDRQKTPETDVTKE